MLPNASLDIFRLLDPLDARRRLLYGDGIGPQVLLNQVSTPARVLRCFFGWGVECEGIGDDLAAWAYIQIEMYLRCHVHILLQHEDRPRFSFFREYCFFSGGGVGYCFFWAVFFLLIVLSRQLWVRILTRGIP